MLSEETGCWARGKDGDAPGDDCAEAADKEVHTDGDVRVGDASSVELVERVQEGRDPESEESEWSGIGVLRMKRRRPQRRAQESGLKSSC